MGGNVVEIAFDRGRYYAVVGTVKNDNQSSCAAI
jgi:hypothetical protein